VVDGYTLTFAAALLTGGALGDSFGARRGFGLGLGLFALASAACGLAPVTGALVAARFVQGLGAALLVPCSLALVRVAYPDAGDRGRAVSIWIGAGGAAVAAGPVIGGLLIDALGWRAIFLVNVLVGAVGIAFTATRLTAALPVPRRIDVVGLLTALAAVGGLTFVLIEGPHLGWTGPVVLGAAAAMVLGAVMFVRYEGRVPEPMFPLELARRPAFVGASLAAGLITLAFFGVVFVLSLFFQQILGQSALVAGLSFLPMTGLIGGANLAAPAVARRIGSLPTIIAGELIFAVGLLGVLTVNAHSSELAVALALVPIGLGGICVPPLTSRLLDAVPPELAGVAAGAYNATRQVGAAIGVAVFGALVVSTRGSQFLRGMRLSLLMGSGAIVVGAALSLALLRHRAAVSD
jgi:DHA2 family methylenomycin A resistance protein-like MFS transporter